MCICHLARVSLDRFLSRFEFQRHTVDAVTKSGRRRAVLEDVTEVAAAIVTVHLRAHHSPGAIGGRTNRALQRCEEAGPSGSALEFAIGDEEPLPTRNAGESTRPMLVQQRARTGTLRRVPAKHSVLLGRQLAAPLFIRFLDRKMCGLHKTCTP